MMDNPDGWTIDAVPGFEPLRHLGWEVVDLPWRSATPGWNEFDAVDVGSPWDYPEDPDGFLAVLEAIHRSNAVPSMTCHMLNGP